MNCEPLPSERLEPEDFDSLVCATNNQERAGFGTHYVVLAYELTSPIQDLPLPLDQHGEFAWLTAAELLLCPEVHANTKAYFKP